MYGAKADNLIKLKEAGFPVPDFTVVPHEEDAEKFVTEFLRTHAGPFAVRSSCNLEDGEDQSFAGQFATYLSVPPENLSEKIQACRESLKQESVREYLNQNGLTAETLRMDVVLQDMVQADRAGVLFTANPQGILNESVIVVAQGLGEGVVSGRANATTYYYQRTDGLYYYEGEKDLLSAEEVEKLIALSKRVEEVIGPYLDIEFAMASGEVFLLQARRITTLHGEAPLILDNSNIVESYPGLSLPLTISFVEMVYGGVFRGVSRRVLKNDKELNKHTAVFQNMVGHANGRLYYKISNWYTVLKFLPMHQKIIPVWQEMMGVHQKSYDAEEVELSPLVRFMTYVNSVYELVSVPRHLKQLEKKFAQVNHDFYETYHEDMTPGELIALYEQIRKDLLDAWDVTLLNDTYTFVFTALVKKRLAKKHPGDEAYANRYISGISNIESMKPVKAIIDLAHDYPKLSNAEKEQRKSAYVKEFGDRNLEELKLESKTFRSHPEILEERIQSYLGDPDRLESTWQELHAEKAKLQQEDTLTRYLGKRCAAGIAGRETSRLNRSRVYGMVREIFRGMGKAYAKGGLLEQAEDVFYLTQEEAFSLAENTDQAELLRQRIAERKADYALFAKLPAYSRLLFEAKEFDKHGSNVTTYEKRDDAKLLQGTPCSAGEVTARALVITKPQDAKNVADQILVTIMTDPGWVFLLTTAKGVISEKGSLLSHTAIISRELGVPSIVGVEHLLESIQTGDLLRMDGNTGKIEILERQHGMR
ncbi:MAG: phosphoenolpyruvate synthase [Acetatifactor sp.]|nr:phosphoenolpyruvate synthase [Acetatifactor sp.]